MPAAGALPAGGVVVSGLAVGAVRSGGQVDAPVFAKVPFARHLSKEH